MIICVCHRVSDRDIAAAVRSGCSSFEELQAELKVATGCGRCGDCARDTMQRCAAAPQQAAGVLPAVSAALASVPGRASMAARRVLLVPATAALPGSAA